ncbi:hypothetical protein FKP32DRAFT_569897 [Trametes sanguinea]|nr:hypothetical protein FKP32DRAFT_569897 [Trametes sanguinea]
MCRKLHAKISRCDKYSRPSWIRQQDIDNDARWSQPAHLEWPIDLAAFNKDFETLTEPVEHVDDNDPTILQLWYWPPELRESTIDDAELGPWKLKHFAPVNYLFPTPSAKECKEVNASPSRYRPRLGPLRTAVFVSMAVRADLPLRDDVVFDMFFDQLPIADVIGIVCTDSQRHYCSRVDAGTYQWLKTILGEPAWFSRTIMVVVSGG